MDIILLLALATFVLVVAFLLWNRISTKRHQETGGRTSGLGGPADPLSGTAEGIRPAEAIQTSLDEAATAPPRAKPIIE